MKDGTTNTTEYTRRVLSDSQAAVLDELQVKGENSCGELYRRTLDAVKTRLIMDDEYDPSENLSLVRVLTMIARDLDVLCDPIDQDGHEQKE